MSLLSMIMVLMMGLSTTPRDERAAKRARVKAEEEEEAKEPPSAKLVTGLFWRNNFTLYHWFNLHNEPLKRFTLVSLSEVEETMGEIRKYMCEFPRVSFGISIGRDLDRRDTNGVRMMGNLPNQEGLQIANAVIVELAREDVNIVQYGIGEREVETNQHIQFHVHRKECLGGNVSRKLPFMELIDWSTETGLIDPLRNYIRNDPAYQKWFW